MEEEDESEDHSREGAIAASREHEISNFQDRTGPEMKERLRPGCHFQNPAPRRGANEQSKA